ncbi:MAG: hypothetical protein ACK58T_48180, partial [Phycisphaerae bacterium]
RIHSVVSWVQRVVPRSDVEKLIPTGDIPRTGVENTVLNHPFVISAKLQLQSISLRLELRINPCEFSLPFRRTVTLAR